MVLAATFRVKNDVFAEWLRMVVRGGETTQDILKEISLGNIKEFAEEDKFLLF